MLTSELKKNDFEKFSLDFTPTTENCDTTAITRHKCDEKKIGDLTTPMF